MGMRLQQLESSEESRTPILGKKYFPKSPNIKSPLYQKPILLILKNNPYIYETGADGMEISLSKKFYKITQVLKKARFSLEIIDHEVAACFEPHLEFESVERAGLEHNVRFYLMVCKKLCFLIHHHKFFSKYSNSQYDILISCVKRLQKLIHSYQLNFSHKYSRLLRRFEKDCYLYGDFGLKLLEIGYQRLYKKIDLENERSQRIDQDYVYKFQLN